MRNNRHNGILMNKSQYTHILFDLDGTLSDPLEGLANSIIYSCEKFGISDYSADEFRSFIGPPLHISYKNRFNLSDEDAARIVRYYREYYEDKGKFENVLYDGITELLADLKAAGCTLAVSTSKPTHFSAQILEHFNIAQYFDVLVGSNLDNTMSDKSDIIAETLRRLSPASLDTCIMIGDRKFDVIGAHKNGIKCIGVLYGYGSREELTENSADQIANDVQSLRNLILRSS